MPDNPEPRRTSTGEIIDATTQGVTSIARLNAQQVVTVISFLGMTFICALLAFQAYSEREERRDERRDRQEAEAVRLREANAQAELLRSHCSSENDKTRRDSQDQVKTILSAFLSEGDRQRLFIKDENEKFRREILAVIKRGPNDP